MTELTNVWSRLSTEGEREEGFVRLRLPEISSCAVYGARRVGDDHEALLLEVRTAALPGFANYPQSAGFNVHGEPIEPGRSGSTRIILSLEHSRFRDVFYSLAEDVLRVVSSARDETEAVGMFLSRLTRWQAFLRKHALTGLSQEERRGLFGELVVLRDKLVTRVDGIDAVRAWTGCRSADHDFQFPGGSLEVKVSSANTPHAFHVNNVGQLDDAGLGVLILCFHVLDESDTVGESLRDVVHSLNDRLPEAAIDELEQSLLEAGYLVGHSNEYATPRYRIRTTRYFRVTNAFPRLLASSLPQGVEDVTYTVALAGCAPFECAENDALRLITAGTQRK